MATESQWVLFRIGSEIFGIEIQFVREMLRMPTVHKVPQASADNHGVVLLREEVIPVFDLTRRFGMVSALEHANELIAMLQARQKDHEDWLAALERSVAEQSEFTLTTDPHACKFGEWYDQFTTENQSLRRVLDQLDHPHKKIHAVGEQVKELQTHERYEQARELIQKTRSIILNHLVKLFEDAQQEIRDYSRQSLIVVGSSAATIGMAVDEIHSVMRCNDEEIQSPDSIPGIENFPGLIGLLPQKNSQKFTMLFDPAALYPQLLSSNSTAVSAAS